MVQRYTSTEVSQYRGTPVQRYTGTEVHQYRGTPVQRYTSTEVVAAVHCRYTGTLVHRRGSLGWLKFLNPGRIRCSLGNVDCTALHCTALHCTALHCTALHCTALHCTALHWCRLGNVIEGTPGILMRIVTGRPVCTALHCTALHCTAHCTALHCGPRATFLLPVPPPTLPGRRGPSRAHTALCIKGAIGHI
jgi:hypothetical protein